MEGYAEELTLAFDKITGDYTRLTRALLKNEWVNYNLLNLKAIKINFS
jgi:hypothetical protein